MSQQTTTQTAVKTTITSQEWYRCVDDEPIYPVLLRFPYGRARATYDLQISRTYSNQRIRFHFNLQQGGTGLDNFSEYMSESGTITVRLSDDTEIQPAVNGVGFISNNEPYNFDKEPGDDGYDDFLAFYNRLDSLTDKTVTTILDDNQGISTPHLAFPRRVRAVVGSFFDVDLPQSVGGEGFINYSVDIPTSLPNLTFSSAYNSTQNTRSLRGRIHTTGVYLLEYTATDANDATDTRDVNITIVDAPTNDLEPDEITTAIPHRFLSSGEGINLTLPEGSGGNGSLYYQLLGEGPRGMPGLPRGLSFDHTPSIRILSGTIHSQAEEGIYTLTYIITDNDGDFVEKDFLIRISNTQNEDRIYVINGEHIESSGIDSVIEVYSLDGEYRRAEAIDLKPFPRIPTTPQAVSVSDRAKGIKFYNNRLYILRSGLITQGTRSGFYINSVLVIDRAGNYIEVLDDLISISELTGLDIRDDKLYTIDSSGTIRVYNISTTDTVEISEERIRTNLYLEGLTVTDSSVYVAQPGNSNEFVQSNFRIREYAKIQTDPSQIASSISNLLIDDEDDRSIRGLDVHDNKFWVVNNVNDDVLVFDSDGNQTGDSFLLRFFGVTYRDISIFVDIYTRITDINPETPTPTFGPLVANPANIDYIDHKLTLPASTYSASPGPDRQWTADISLPAYLFEDIVSYTFRRFFFNRTSDSYELILHINNIGPEVDTYNLIDLWSYGFESLIFSHPDGNISDLVIPGPNNSNNEIVDANGDEPYTWKPNETRDSEILNWFNNYDSSDDICITFRVSLSTGISPAKITPSPTFTPSVGTYVGVDYINIELEPETPAPTFDPSASAYTPTVPFTVANFDQDGLLEPIVLAVLRANVSGGDLVTDPAEAIGTGDLAIDEDNDFNLTRIQVSSSVIITIRGSNTGGGEGQNRFVDYFGTNGTYRRDVHLYIQTEDGVSKYNIVNAFNNIAQWSLEGSDNADTDDIVTNQYFIIAIAQDEPEYISISLNPETPAPTFGVAAGIYVPTITYRNVSLDIEVPVPTFDPVGSTYSGPVTYISINLDPETPAPTWEPSVDTYEEALFELITSRTHLVGDGGARIYSLNNPLVGTNVTGTQIVNLPNNIAGFAYRESDQKFYFIQGNHNIYRIDNFSPFQTTLLGDIARESSDGAPNALVIDRSDRVFVFYDNGRYRWSESPSSSDIADVEASDGFRLTRNNVNVTAIRAATVKSNNNLLVVRSTGDFYEVASPTTSGASSLIGRIRKLVDGVNTFYGVYGLSLDSEGTLWASDLDDLGWIEDVEPDGFSITSGQFFVDEFKPYSGLTSIRALAVGTSTTVSILFQGESTPEPTVSVRPEAYIPDIDYNDIELNPVTPEPTYNPSAGTFPLVRVGISLNPVTPEPVIGILANTFALTSQDIELNPVTPEPVFDISASVFDPGFEEVSLNPVTPEPTWEVSPEAQVFYQNAVLNPVTPVSEIDININTYRSYGLISLNPETPAPVWGIVAVSYDPGAPFTTADFDQTGLEAPIVLAVVQASIRGNSLLNPPAMGAGDLTIDEDNNFNLTQIIRASSTLLNINGSNTGGGDNQNSFITYFGSGGIYSRQVHLYIQTADGVSKYRHFQSFNNIARWTLVDDDDADVVGITNNQYFIVAIAQDIPTYINIELNPETPAPTISTSAGIYLPVYNDVETSLEVPEPTINPIVSIISTIYNDVLVFATTPAPTIDINLAGTHVFIGVEIETPVPTIDIDVNLVALSYTNIANINPVTSEPTFDPDVDTFSLVRQSISLNPETPVPEWTPGVSRIIEMGAGRYIWAARRRVTGQPNTGDTVPNDWGMPVLIDVPSVDGVNGNDGNGIEYIFCRVGVSNIVVNSGTGEIALAMSHRPNNSWPFDVPGTSDGVIWFDALPTKTETFPYAFISTRSVPGTPVPGATPQDSWGDWTIPASIGEPGRDGPKGDKGDKGDTGNDGEQGPQGIPGNDGNDGTDGADGHPQYVAPTTPVLSATPGLGGTIIVRWDRHIESEPWLNGHRIQVFDDPNGATGRYAPDVSGSGDDWKTGNTGGYLLIAGYNLEHVAIPLTPGSTETRTLYYRVRREVTNPQGNTVTSSWSNTASATAKLIVGDEVAHGAIGASHVASQFLETLVAEVYNNITVGDSENEGSLIFPGGLGRNVLYRAYVDRDEYSLERNYGTNRNPDWRKMLSVVQTTTALDEAIPTGAINPTGSRPALIFYERDSDGDVTRWAQLNSFALEFYGADGVAEVGDGRTKVVRSEILLQRYSGMEFGWNNALRLYQEFSGGGTGGHIDVRDSSGTLKVELQPNGIDMIGNSRLDFYETPSSSNPKVYINSPGQYLNVNNRIRTEDGVLVNHRLHTTSDRTGDELYDTFSPSIRFTSETLNVSGLFQASGHTDRMIVVSQAVRIEVPDSRIILRGMTSPVNLTPPLLTQRNCDNGSSTVIADKISMSF